MPGEGTGTKSSGGGKIETTKRGGKTKTVTKGAGGKKRISIY